MSSYGTASSFHLPAAVWVIYLAVLILSIVAAWRIFTKAGKPGWWAIIPIVNTVVLCKIAGKPGWWFFLCLIPIANIVFLILIYLGLARSFGKDGGFAVGLILLAPIFFPILAFGSARYQGSYGGAQPATPGYYPPQGPPPGYYPPQALPPGY